MITDTIKPLKGHVTIEVLDGNTVVKILEKDNAITANMKNVVRRAIAGEPYHIDEIKVYAAGVLLATGTLTTDFSMADTVIFTSIFNESSFSGTFDELNLCVSYDTSIFSILTAISITKAVDQKVSIRWKLKIQQ